MLSDELPKQISLLVDALRKQKSDNVSLTDVAAVTEVLIGTMQAFFRSIDTSVYRECRSLSEYIVNARREIASLQPQDLEDARIPRAGLELDAIVQHTEKATNTIMNSAEAIMALDPELPPAEYQAAVQDNVMEIFEACSFQDITGQRISKVVETLAHIETRVTELRNLLGVTQEDIDHAQAASDEEKASISEEESLLRGPALDGEGIDQSAVDALLGGEASAAAQPAAPAPKPAPTPAPQPAAAKPAAPPPPPPPKPVDPAKLDNMLAEDFDFEAEMAAKKAKPEAPAPKAADASVTAKATANPAAAKAPEPEAKKEEAAEDLMEAGKDVSQDDIDALFG